MTKASSDIKKIGRPKVGDAGVFVRLPLKPLDTWIKAHPDPKPSRPEAIRRLVELGIASSQPDRPHSSAAQSKSSAMAGREIDRMGDKSATDDERASRKRRLLKGPKEFRDTRGDLTKPKR